MSASETEVVDERVAVATKHWGPRFVAQGVDLNDFNRTLARIKRWDDWCREWGVTAAEYERLAEAAEAGGTTSPPRSRGCEPPSAGTSASSSSSRTWLN